MDDTLFEYKNWAPFEPNSPDERCVEVRPDSGLWSDARCLQEYGYVCGYTKGIIYYVLSNALGLIYQY